MSIKDATTQIEQSVHETSLKDVFVIERPTFKDERGSFHEDFRLNELEIALGEPVVIRQANVSRNYEAGTLRGIHAAPWAKLVRAVVGTIQVVVVDLRRESDTFGQVWTDMIGDNGRNASVWVPAHCGNAYMTLESGVAYAYDVTAEFQPDKEVSVCWNDPELSIPWRFDKLPNSLRKPILSPKDADSPTLRDVMSKGLLQR